MRNNWDNVTFELVRALLSYDPHTGALRSNKTGEPVGFPQARRYIGVAVAGGIYKAHRVIWLWMTGEKLGPETKVDHINGDWTDNRWENLRKATNAENVRNQRGRSSSAGLKGVHRNGKAKRWRGRICVDGRHLHLGYFNTPEEAHEAYWAAAQKHFGEFARKE